MNKFKKGGFKSNNDDFGGRPKFGGGKKFGGGGKFGAPRDGGAVRHQRPIELFSAICAECKKPCQVPFRPNGEKPVYCRDCFNKQGYVPGRNSNGADGPRPDFRRNDFAPSAPHREHQPQSNFQPQAQSHPQPLRSESLADFAALRGQIFSLETKVNRIIELLSQKKEAPVIAPVVASVQSSKKTAVVAKKDSTKKVIAKKAKGKK